MTTTDIWLREVPEAFRPAFRAAKIGSKRQLALVASLPVATVHAFFSDSYTHKSLAVSKAIADGCGWTLQEYFDLAKILTPIALGSAVRARLNEQGTNTFAYGKKVSRPKTIQKHAIGGSTLAHLRNYYAIGSALGLNLDAFYEILLSEGLVDKGSQSCKLSLEASIVSQSLSYAA